MRKKNPSILLSIEINANCRWPIPFHINVFIALKGSQFYFLFAITAAGVVPCGGPKKSPRTSSIVQVIFSF